MYLTFVQKNYHQLDTNFIVNLISTLVMNNLFMMVTNIQDKKKLYYKYKILYDKVWVTKQKVFEHLFGSYEESFEKLPRLLLEIKESILECLLPRSTKKILMIVQWYLGEFFGHLDLILKGSRLVSNIINIDGTHLCG